MNREMGLEMTAERPIFNARQVQSIDELRSDQEYLLHRAVISCDQGDGLSVIKLTDSIQRIYPLFVLVTDVGSALFANDEQGARQLWALSEIGLEDISGYWTNRAWIEDPKK